MITLSLRYADNYAPKEGTIFHHKKIIDEKGYVWYGKFGNKISQKNIDLVLANKNSRILLIKSGGQERYWAYIEDIKCDYKPEPDFIPEYYRKSSNSIKCWIKIVKLESAESNIMSKCYVLSTGNPLSLSSKHSMNPFFIIDYKAGDENAS